MKSLRGFGQPIGATRMVISGHDSGPAEPLDGISNSPIVGGNNDSAHQTRLFHAPVNVLYQGFSFDFGYRFSRETSGIKAGGNDRDCGISLHQTPQFILARAVGHGRSPLAENLHLSVWRLEEISKKWETDPGCFLEVHLNIMTLVQADTRQGTLREGR